MAPYLRYETLIRVDVTLLQQDEFSQFHEMNFNLYVTSICTSKHSSRNYMERRTKYHWESKHPFLEAVIAHHSLNYWP